MGPVKRSKHSTGFKIKVIQFAKENGNRAAARMFDIGESSIILREKTKVSQMLRLRKQKKYLLSHIGNMDETLVTFHIIENNTIDKKGTKTIYIKTTGHEKSHFTVVPSCLADGPKFKPMVILKRKTAPKSNFPKGVFIHVHEKGSMDENGVKLWIKNVWRKRPGALRNPQSLLVWNMFRSHLTDNTKKLLTECNTDIAVITGGLTPLDVCINKPFTQNLKRQRNMWMLDGEKLFTKGGQMCVMPAARHHSIRSTDRGLRITGLVGTKDDYLFMKESNSDGENDTNFDEVSEDITEDEYADLFMLFNNESS
ncbi:pogo transposable element with KRAB domain [Trichonephila clavipes]|nr:pogo transposable element with KRAB domain [Trichonephila clavipes]